MKDVKGFPMENLKTLIKKKLKTLDNGTSVHAPGLIEFTLWKWLPSRKQYIDSMQYSQIPKTVFKELRKFSIFMETQSLW